MKPFSESCEQNKIPILDVLKRFYSEVETVLEIGSGTGQHAIFFAEQFPHLTWMASDQVEYHAGIQMWLKESELNNVQGPCLLDVDQNDWPLKQTDAIFSANTVHIMAGKVLKICLQG
jgi:tRNA G46 methylase TrmB